MEKCPNNPKMFKRTRMLPSASERICTCRNASKKVRIAFNRSSTFLNLGKLRKAHENFAKTSQELRHGQVCVAVFLWYRATRFAESIHSVNFSLVCSFVFCWSEFFSTAQTLLQHILGWRNRFRPKITEIGAILAILSHSKFCCRQHLVKNHEKNPHATFWRIQPIVPGLARISLPWHHDLHKSWDNQLNSPKKGHVDFSFAFLMAGRETMICCVWKWQSRLVLDARNQLCLGTKCHFSFRKDESSCLETKNHFSWERQIVLFGSNT